MVAGLATGCSDRLTKRNNWDQPEHERENHVERNMVADP
jgi:hypothetical protein